MFKHIMRRTAVNCRMNNSVALAYIVLLTIVLAGCGSNREKTMTVVASFAPQEWMLRQIAGDSIRVVTLLPPGTDAENYQPSPSTLKAMADADVWLTLGTDGFESSLQSTAKSNFPDLDIEDCTAGIEKIYGTHEGEDSFDPHLLASVRNSITIAQNMTDILCQLYPGLTDGMRNRSAKLIADMSAQDERMGNLNIKGGKFAIRHPSLSYFARDYGLIQLPLEMEGKETTPKQLMERLEEIKSQQPGVMVIDAKHATDRDRDMADDLQMMPLVVTLDGEDWLIGLERIAQKLQNGGKQPETDSAK